MRRILLFLALATFAVGSWSAAQADADLVHSVGEGETLIAIASAYGLTLDELLRLNNLDPEAFLQIGQRLIIIPAGQRAAAATEAAATPLPTPTATAQRVAGNLGAGDSPPAPVRIAAAPMFDPAALSAGVCISIFEDANHNAMREPGEPLLNDGMILLLDSAESERWRYAPASEEAPGCARNLTRDVYHVRASPPAGFGWTGPASARLDLRAGGSVQLDFGAARDRAPFAPPPLATPVPPPQQMQEASLLRELSGLFFLLMAGAVLVCGAAVSLFLRGR